MNRRVLLVDDRADFQEGVRQMLAPHFEVHTAASGAEALAKLERHGPFAVVVSDYGMPGMTGIELLSELLQRVPDTVRILLTGCVDLGLALEALERGAIFRFLTKPTQPKRLLEAVCAGVERYHATAEERLFTEQLAFAREALQELNASLEYRLEDALESLGALAHHAGAIGAAGTLEDVLARTTVALEELLGARAAEVVVRAGTDEIEIVPSATLPHGARRSLAILGATARGAAASAQRHHQAAEAGKAILRALESLARRRDDQTGQHLARVSRYARILGGALLAAGRHALVTPEFVERVALAAPLHDIGKVAIPDAILLKPGKLDEREWAIMRTHAAEGAEILRGVLEGAHESDEPLLAIAHEIAWTHHERWDGTGYPRQLAREKIPLAGRIMALVDCYDALTSERPYKHAWPHAAAATYLDEQRGLAFDPELVAAFFAREAEFEAVRAEMGAPAPH